ncbi:MAG: hypothetical protein JW891_00100 [Candidatus Lokiarchaeota archaeon]|nr:hypothetical protein [Candidatus Lokiarchaeota archaeon]
MNEFFIKTYNYLVDHIETAMKGIDKNTVTNCLELLNKGKTNKRVIVDGAGRSLQSVLLLTNELDNAYGIRVNQVSNANLRPLRSGDIFIVNSRSGSGKSYESAMFAKKKGLDVIFITGNEKLKDDFENVILVKANSNRDVKCAPLGTEFEQASAVFCSCVGYAYGESEMTKAYDLYSSVAVEGMRSNLNNLKREEKIIDNFISLITELLDPQNESVVYFKGVGSNEIIARVIAIRYGHLNKEGKKDLNVVYEGHWKSRKKNDLAILMSGSGETDQILKYAHQAGDIGMNLFTITSFKDSSLARRNKWYRNYAGNLIIEGRPEMLSYYNKSIHNIEEKFFPQFELNTYVTLDALLAAIAKENDITEDDMKKTHRDKELE